MARPHRYGAPRPALPAAGAEASAAAGNTVTHEQMQGITDAAAPLREAWYYAVPSRCLRRRAMLAKVMLGEPILIGRDAAGVPLSMRHLCLHRVVPLDFGR